MSGSLRKHTKYIVTVISDIMAYLDVKVSAFTIYHTMVYNSQVLLHFETSSNKNVKYMHVYPLAQVMGMYVHKSTSFICRFGKS